MYFDLIVTVIVPHLNIIMTLRNTKLIFQNRWWRSNWFIGSFIRGLLMNTFAMFVFVVAFIDHFQSKKVHQLIYGLYQLRQKICTSKLIYEDCEPIWLLLSICNFACHALCRVARTCLSLPRKYSAGSLAWQHGASNMAASGNLL